MKSTFRPVEASHLARGQVADAAGTSPRVLLVGENASLQMGGEASFPYLYFKLLRAGGVEVWLASHARVRDELRELLGDDFDRVSFVEDNAFDLALFRTEKYLPIKLRDQTTSVLRHVVCRC